MLWSHSSILISCSLPFLNLQAFPGYQTKHVCCVIVKQLARHCASNFVDVIEGRQSADFDHLGTSKEFPVKAFRGKIAAKALVKLVE